MGSKGSSSRESIKRTMRLETLTGIPIVIEKKRMTVGMHVKVSSRRPGDSGELEHASKHLENP